MANTIPVAMPQSVSVNTNGSVNIVLQAQDADGDPLTYGIQQTPQHQSAITLTGNTVTYTPTQNYSGPDSFKFWVTDGAAFSTPATVSITVGEDDFLLTFVTGTLIPAIKQRQLQEQQEYIDSLRITDTTLQSCFDGTVPQGQELYDLTSFICEGKDLSAVDMSNLGQLANLQTLELPHSKLSDISALSSLKNLTRLDLAANELTDISSLAGITKLTYLNLGFNEIANIGSLSGMTQLQELHLDANKIASISALNNKTALRKLWLDDNQLTDTGISALSSLTNLTHLGLGYNEISNVSPLSHLNALQTLVLDANELDSDPNTGIGALSNLTNLRKLHLRGNLITDITALIGLINLEVLEIGFNQISSAVPLLNLTGLTRLGMENNNLQSVASLTNMNNLQNLDLENNVLDTTTGISSLSGLNGLLRLQNNLLLDEDVNALSLMSNSFDLLLDDNCLASVSLNNNIHIHGELPYYKDQDWQFPASHCNGTAPVAYSNAENVVNSSNTTITLHAYDPNNDAMTFRLESINVSGGTLRNTDGSVATVGNLSSGEVVFYPQTNYLGDGGNFTFSVTDTHDNKSQIVTVYIRVIHPMLVACYGDNIPSDSELASKTELSDGECTNKGLTNISALADYYPNLTKVFLGGNPIADYSPLASLPHLNALSLKGNTLDSADLTVLSGLSNLAILELDNCQIDNADLNYLDGLSNLVHLYLNDNQITSLSNLSGDLPNLAFLKLNNNGITDLSPLAGKSTLQTLYLNNNGLATNQAANLSVLSNLGSLTYLELEHNDLTSINGLQNLGSLGTLTLRSNRLLTADALKNFTQKVSIYLANNCLDSNYSLTGWGSNITLDSSGAQRAPVNGACPAP